MKRSVHYLCKAKYESWCKCSKGQVPGVKDNDLEDALWSNLCQNSKKICVCFDFGEKQNINITKYFRFLDKN